MVDTPTRSLSRTATLPSKVSFGECQKCNSERTGKFWCQKCEAQAFQDKLWSSGNDHIDDLIRETQKNARTNCNYLEWIPCDQFQSVEKIAQGGFGVVYRATWLCGPRNKPNQEKTTFERAGSTDVALKKLNKNSKEISKEFLDELRAYFMFTGETTISRIEVTEYKCILQSYGITKDPDTHDYMMVMEYAPEGDLRKFLRHNFDSLTWRSRLDHLWEIAFGLENIHKANLVHGDFHSGNILKRTEGIAIGDLGLSKRADPGTKGAKGVYGVMTYLPPEVLRGGDYTDKADVYSFSMIMWEMISGEIPFARRLHDSDLQLRILDGERPPIIEGTPSFYQETMEKCWSTDPKVRPTAMELQETIKEWIVDSKHYPELMEMERKRSEKQKNLQRSIESNRSAWNRIPVTAEDMAIGSQSPETLLGIQGILGIQGSAESQEDSREALHALTAEHPNRLSKPNQMQTAFQDSRENEHEISASDQVDPEKVPQINIEFVDSKNQVHKLEENSAAQNLPSQDSQESTLEPTSETSRETTH